VIVFPPGRPQLVLKFLEGECGDVFAQHFLLKSRDQFLLNPVTANDQRIGAHATILVERASVLCPPDTPASRNEHDVGVTETALQEAREEIACRVRSRTEADGLTA
jgi:hypothetical protein